MEKDYLKIAGNIHLSYFVEAADILGIDYEIVIPSLTAKFTSNGKIWYINNTVTPLTSAPSAKLARTKHFANKILALHKIPVPKQEKLAKEIDAISFYGKYKDIVIKPSQNIGGHGVTILPKNETEVLNAYKYASDNNKKGVILGEEFIHGDNYRVLVLGDKVLSVVKRIPAQVSGDEVSTISQLIERKNQERKEKVMLPILIDNELKTYLGHKNLNLDSIPSENEIVQLRANANMTTGGTTKEVNGSVAQYYKDICIKAVKSLGMQYGGVDLITPKIEEEAKCAINEINYNPGLRIHYKVDEGKPQKVAIDIMKYIKDTI